MGVNHLRHLCHCCADLHRQGRFMHEIGCMGSDDMHSQNLAAGCIGNDLEEPGRISCCLGLPHSGISKTSHRHSQVGILPCCLHLFAGLLFRHTDTTDLR